MGMFDFSWKTEEQLALKDEIKVATEWISKLLNAAGYKAELKLEALKEVDRFFNDNMDDNLHKPKADGLLSAHTSQSLFAIGAFLGAVLIMEQGGKWRTNDKDEHGRMNMTVELANGSIIIPVHRVMNRCLYGPEWDIYSFAADILSSDDTAEK